MIGERQLGGDREISILLPDKYLVEDSMNPGLTALISYAMNADHAWNGKAVAMAQHAWATGRSTSNTGTDEAALRHMRRLK
jgi:hypothetical protein